MTDPAENIINPLEKLYAKAPQLPKKAKDTIVKFIPWIVLIFGILGILGALGGLGLMTVFSPLALLGGASAVGSLGGGFVISIFWLLASVLMLAAYQGTKARKLKGWKLLFWSQIVALVSSLVSGSLGSGLIGAIIGYYFLFQIKSYYK